VSESIPEWNNIAVTVRGEIVELRFHTGEDSLVWSATAHREAMEAFAWVGYRRSTQAVIITGAGADFCTRIDVNSFKGISWEEIAWEGRRMVLNLSDIEVPVISAINGPATCHSEIVVVADIVIASETATFGDHVHMTRNTAPGDGVHAVWGQLLGPSRSRHFLLTAATIGVDEGLRLGFVHEVLPAGLVLARAWELAESFASKPHGVLRFAKATVSIPFRRFLAEDISHGFGLEGSGHWTDGGIKE
jgi:enoyl-CoA hydratase/carnithine racemase